VKAKYFIKISPKKVLGIISFGCALAAMLVFVIVGESPELNGFWDKGAVRFWLGMILCFFPAGQGAAAFLIKGVKSPKSLLWLKILFGLTLFHLIILIQLAAFLRFPLAFVPLDAIWIFYLSRLFNTKRITVKKIFEDTPAEVKKEKNLEGELISLAVNTPDERGLTLLMHAALINDAKTMRKLLKQPGININLRHAGTGNTALQIAAGNGNFDCAKILLFTQGIDTSVRNKDGLNAFELASANGYYDIADMLRR